MALHRPLLACCLVAAGLLCAMRPACAAPAAPCLQDGWPAWERFKASLLRSGGRILDPSSSRATTVSEGQAYALFFALVADDRSAFEDLVRWTEDNLAGGDLALRLPAWQWGRRDDGSYGVLDANPAADADLWLAYALGEAGRLWQERRYRALSSLLAERIVGEESADIAGLGRSLLPGAQGFAPVQGRWRLNPSYAPPFLLRWLATRSTDPRWEAMRRSAQRVLLESAPSGFVPDWAVFHEPGADDRGGFRSPAADARDGSYDAIRAYLWLGMTGADDADRDRALRQLTPMADLTERAGLPPEHVDVASGKPQGVGPVGFSAALLPFLEALGRSAALAAQEQRLRTQAPVGYYDQALALFGSGWRERRFAFGRDGALRVAWQACAAPPAPAATAP